MVDSDSENVGDSALLVIGKQLAAARESAGMERQAVAKELHLRVEVIEAIESGDEAALPAAAFIRGYVRSYARCVGLDDVALVAGLPHAVEHRPVPRQGSRQRYLAPSIPLGRFLVWGLILLVLLVLVLYGAPAVERLWSGQQSRPVDNTLQLPESGFRSPDVDAQALPANEGSDTSGQPESELPQEAPDVEGASLVVPDSGSTKNTPVTAASDPNDSGGPAELTLRFTQDSWVEMTSRDRKLVIGTQRAGTERTVRAEPPIDILLGNSPSVEMHWRGKPFDITPYQRGKVARIKLER